MNEPIFTLKETPQGARRIFADPFAPAPDLTPPIPPIRRPMRTRLLAGLFWAGAATGRRMFPVRS